MPYVIKPTGLA